MRLPCILLLMLLRTSHSLPARTEELVKEGNAELAKFQNEGQNIHQIAFQNKEVTNSIDAFVGNFSASTVITNPNSTIELLTRSEKNFNVVQENVNRLSAEEKEISALIQKIFERQQQGAGESAKIQAELRTTEENIRATDQQIVHTQSEINRLQNEINDLQQKVADAERQVKRRRRRRKWWIIGTIATGGLAGFGLAQNERRIRDFKRVRGDREAMLQRTRDNFNNLHASKATSEANKARLTQTLAELQNELLIIGDMLNRLQSALQDTVKYRSFLVSLSDAYKEVKVHIQRLVKNLEQVSTVHTEGITPDSSIENSLKKSHADLAESWAIAIKRPAVQATLALTDLNNVGATLTIIKSQDWTLSLK